MWLDEFIAKQRERNDFLRAAGAEPIADGRDLLLKELHRAAAEAGERTVDVEEASERTGVHPETVRRAVRAGELTDLREGTGKMLVLVKELDILRGRARGLDRNEEDSYDASSFGRTIALMED